MSWLYFRFPLSLRMIEEMLAARGICVTFGTVRQWKEVWQGLCRPNPAASAGSREILLGNLWRRGHVALHSQRMRDQPLICAPAARTLYPN